MMAAVKYLFSSIFKIIFIIVLMIGSFVYAMFQGGFVSWFLLGSFFPLAFYSCILYFFPMRTLSIKRSISRKEYNAGEEVEVTIVLERKNRFPIFFLVIEDKVPDKLKRRTGQSFKTVLFPFFKRKIESVYTIQNIPRGEYEFQSIRMVAADLFGFVKREAMTQQKDKILVYPSYVEMVYEPFENQFELGATATKDLVQRDSTMAISIREYEPGDRFSWIHWKASARKNEIMTKEFEQRQTHDILLVLDRTPHPSFDLSVTFAASAIRAISRKGAEAGLYSFGDKKDYFPAKRGEMQIRTLFYYLASVEDVANVPLSNILESDPLFMNQNRALMIIVNELRRTDAEKISSMNRKKGNIILFVVKAKHEKVQAEETELLEFARSRGVIAKVIYDGQFAGAFGRSEW